MFLGNERLLLIRWYIIYSGKELLAGVTKLYSLSLFLYCPCRFHYSLIARIDRNGLCLYRICAETLQNHSIMMHLLFTMINVRLLEKLK